MFKTINCRLLQFHLISCTSVLVNLMPHWGHFLFRLFVVSSMHLLQNKWGQLFNTTSLSRSPVQLHIILLLYSFNSIFKTSFSVVAIKAYTLFLSSLIYDFKVSFSVCSFCIFFYFSALSSTVFFSKIYFSRNSFEQFSSSFLWLSNQFS